MMCAGIQKLSGNLNETAAEAATFYKQGNVEADRELKILEDSIERLRGALKGLIKQYPITVDFVPVSNKEHLQHIALLDAISALDEKP